MRKIVLSLLSLGFVPAVASARPHFFGFFFGVPAPICTTEVTVAPAPVCIEPAPTVTIVAPVPVVRVIAPPPFFFHPPFWGARHFHR
jgi:hypothetical protein